MDSNSRLKLFNPNLNVGESGKGTRGGGEQNEHGHGGTWPGDL